MLKQPNPNPSYHFPHFWFVFFTHRADSRFGLGLLGRTSEWSIILWHFVDKPSLNIVYRILTQIDWPSHRSNFAVSYSYGRGLEFLQIVYFPSSGNGVRCAWLVTPSTRQVDLLPSYRIYSKRSAGELLYSLLWYSKPAWAVSTLEGSTRNNFFITWNLKFYIKRMARISRPPLDFRDFVSCFKRLCMRGCMTLSLSWRTHQKLQGFFLACCQNKLLFYYKSPTNFWFQVLKNDKYYEAGDIWRTKNFARNKKCR